MNIIIQSSIHTLNKSKLLLTRLSNEELRNISVPPYYSCIGSHIRHVLDFYDCILSGIKSAHVDLTNRERDIRLHEDCQYAHTNVIRVIDQLDLLNTEDLKRSLIVLDDLGIGKVEIEYSLGAALAQANSHAIHHYAIINYILDRLDISVEDETFGYNPTTPRPEINLI